VIRLKLVGIANHVKQGAVLLFAVYGEVKHTILARYSVAHVELQQQGLRSKSGRTFFLKQLALFSSLPSHRLGQHVIRLQHLVALGTA
jgi:hypothetical protein